MDLNEFNDKYVHKLLDNIAKENKTFLLGDFNIALLKFDSHTPTIDFSGYLSFSVVSPYILHPTRVTVHFKAFFDNMFSNLYQNNLFVEI